MWKGAISFGLVAIPVRMYLATESHSVSFRLLCPSCHNPIRNKRYCPVEDRDLQWNETLRGYEVSKDEYVVIDDEDLDRLPLPTAQAIEILEFVPDSDIEAGLYMKQAYYLEPEPVGARPYALLREALRKTGRVAIGRLALRDREHLARLAIHDNCILLNTLHWPDEIRSTAELAIPDSDTAVGDRELAMAVNLVENLAASFDPGRHSDRYREALLQIVEEKLGNREVARVEPAEPARMIDLMAALKASVDATRQRQAEPGAKSRHAAEEAAGAATRPRRRKVS